MPEPNKEQRILSSLEFKKKQIIKNYEKKLRVRKNETPEEWEKRTKLYRFRHEDELKKLKVQIKDQKVKATLSVRKKDPKRIEYFDKYESKYRIVIDVKKKPLYFFQNSMIILNFAELKYGIPKTDLLVLMNLYSQERPFTQEELEYKIHLFTNSKRRFHLYCRKGYLKRFIKKDFPGGPKKTDLFTVHVSISKLIDRLYLMMIGEIDLKEFEYLKKKYPYIKDGFEILKQEIITMKSKFDNSEYIRTIEEEH